MAEDGINWRESLRRRGLLVGDMDDPHDTAGYDADDGDDFHEVVIGRDWSRVTDDPDEVAPGPALDYPTRSVFDDTAEPMTPEDSIALVRAYPQLKEIGVTNDIQEQRWGPEAGEHYKERVDAIQRWDATVYDALQRHKRRLADHDHIVPDTDDGARSAWRLYNALRAWQSATPSVEGAARSVESQLGDFLIEAFEKNGRPAVRIGRSSTSVFRRTVDTAVRSVRRAVLGVEYTIPKDVFSRFFNESRIAEYVSTVRGPVSAAEGKALVDGFLETIGPELRESLVASGVSKDALAQFDAALLRHKKIPGLHNYASAANLSRDVNMSYADASKIKRMGQALSRELKDVAMKTKDAVTAFSKGARSTIRRLPVVDAVITSAEVVGGTMQRLDEASVYAVLDDVRGGMDVQKSKRKRHVVIYPEFNQVIKMVAMRDPKDPIVKKTVNWMLAVHGRGTNAQAWADIAGAAANAAAWTAITGAAGAATAAATPVTLGGASPLTGTITVAGAARTAVAFASLGMAISSLEDMFVDHYMQSDLAEARKFGVIDDKPSK